MLWPIFALRARIGNTSVDSNINTFTVDTVAPDTTITANPATPANSASAAFSFTGDDGSGAGNGNFAGQVYTIDKIAPQAGSLAAATITSGGGTTHSFTVVFSDNLALAIASLDGNDIRVTGPGGFTQLAALVSVTSGGNGIPRTATYRISAPGGAWDSGDNGVYAVALEANQVRDTAGNLVAAKTLGTFSVSVGATRHTVFLPLVQR